MTMVTACLARGLFRFELRKLLRQYQLLDAAGLSVEALNTWNLSPLEHDPIMNRAQAPEDRPTPHVATGGLHRGPSQPRHPLRGLRAGLRGGGREGLQPEQPAARKRLAFREALPDGPPANPEEVRGISMKSMPKTGCRPVVDPLFSRKRHLKRRKPPILVGTTTGSMPWMWLMPPGAWQTYATWWSTSPSTRPLRYSSPAWGTLWVILGCLGAPFSMRNHEEIDRNRLK